MNILLFSDDPRRFSADKDTTRAIVEYGIEAGARFSWCDPRHLYWRDETLRVAAADISPSEGADWIEIDESRERPVTAFDAVLIRSDPPVGLVYQRLCQLLCLVEHLVPVINPPAAILCHNEKLSALRFSRYMTDTFVGFNTIKDDTFSNFFENGVYKSLDSLGGEGVARIPDDAESAALVRNDLARGPDKSSNGDYLMAQRWIEGVEKGDKRVIMIDGSFAGVILRVPTAGEFRGNIHMGGQVEATELTSREWKIVREVGAWLRACNIGLCGLDLVAGMLTEINITSPTGFREIEALTPWRPTAVFWEYLTRRVRIG